MWTDGWVGEDGCGWVDVNIWMDEGDGDSCMKMDWVDVQTYRWTI